MPKTPLTMNMKNDLHSLFVGGKAIYQMLFQTSVDFFPYFFNRSFYYKEFDL
jgi:hypothetical protein